MINHHMWLKIVLCCAGFSDKTRDWNYFCLVLWMAAAILLALQSCMSLPGALQLLYLVSAVPDRKTECLVTAAALSVGFDAAEELQSIEIFMVVLSSAFSQLTWCELWCAAV